MVVLCENVNVSRLGNLVFSYDVHNKRYPNVNCEAVIVMRIHPTDLFFLHKLEPLMFS